MATQLNHNTPFEDITAEVGLELFHCEMERGIIRQRARLLGPPRPTATRWDDENRNSQCDYLGHRSGVYLGFTMAQCADGQILGTALEVVLADVLSQLLPGHFELFYEGYVAWLKSLRKSAYRGREETTARYTIFRVLREYATAQQTWTAGQAQ